MSTSPKAAREAPLDAAAPAFEYREAPAGEAGNPSARASGAELERARQEGREEAARQFAAQLAAKIGELQTLAAQNLEQFGEERRSYFARLEREVIELVLAIARKILAREATCDPLLLAGAVHVALGRLEDSAPVTLHVHPARAAEWREHVAHIPGGSAPPAVAEDPNLEPDACRLEAGTGTALFSVNQSLEILEQSFVRLLAERPGSAR
jgi:flagellar assembly protein FliH